VTVCASLEGIASVGSPAAHAGLPAAQQKILAVVFPRTSGGTRNHYEISV